MNAARSLPSLFGRFTAILKDHEHIGVTRRQLLKMCEALERNPLALPEELSPPTLIGEFRADLLEHFSAEESADYFGTVVEEDPTLAAQIDALKWEHQLMLRALDVLSELVNDRARWEGITPRMRELLAQLERHERRENTLLRDLFRRQD
jgi:hypothetical protein